MKKTLMIMLSLAAAQLLAADDLRLLKAIAQVESGNNPFAVGKDGEITAYQITPGNWRRQTTFGTEFATNVRIGRWVALKHLRWLRKQLQRDRPEVLACDLEGPYIMAMAWHCGAHGQYYGNSEAHDYAMRVVNIYGDLKTPQMIESE